MTEKAFDGTEIIRATNSDLPHVKALWQEIFGDNEEFIEGFYRAFPIKENTLVAKVGERVVGMANALDCTLAYENERFCGKYIYALAVSGEHRGMGIAKALLDACEEGNFVLLVPETPDLYCMYAHLGYNKMVQADSRFTEPQLFLTEGENGECVSALLKLKDSKLEDFDYKKVEFHI